MTREEIAKSLNILKEQALRSHNDTAILDVKVESFVWVVESAIQALSQEPRTTTNNNEPITIIYPTITCDDAINRDAVIKDFTQWRGELAYAVGEDYSGVSVLDKAIRVIKGMPSVTQKCEKCAMNGSGSKYCDNCGPKSGKWVEIDDEPHEVWECDHCGFVIDGSGCIEPYEYRDIYKYCPNCGCRMFEPQESEDKE